MQGIDISTQGSWSMLVSGSYCVGISHSVTSLNKSSMKNLITYLFVMAFLIHRRAPPWKFTILVLFCIYQYWYQEAQVGFNKYLEAQGSHDEVYTDGSKMNKRVGAAVVISHHFQNRQPATNCPKDCRTTASSLQLMIQPSLWRHWTITNTWAQSITM